MHKNKIGGIIDNLAASGLSYMSGMDQSHMSTTQIISFYQELIFSNISTNNMIEYFKNKVLSTLQNKKDGF